MWDIFDDFNEEEEILLDFDQEWIYEEGRIYYCGIGFILFWLGLYFLATCYLISGVSLIWDVTEEDEGDEIIANYEIDFKRYWGVTVEWETLIDYIQSINPEPSLNKEDLEDLEEFCIALDKIKYNKNNMILWDYNLNENVDILSSVGNIKMITLQNIDFKSFELDSHIIEREDFVEVESNISKDNLNILKQDPKLARRMSFIANTNKRKQAKYRTEMNILDRQFYDKLVVRNKTAVGQSFNYGFYPVSNYDCDRALIIDDELSFVDYPLFDNCSDDLEQIDSSLIEYKIKI